MSDVRQASVEQKLMSFYSIIDRCLTDNQQINIVVLLGGKEEKKVELIYSSVLAKYLQIENFNLVFVKPTVWGGGKLISLSYAINYFLRLRGIFAQRVNFACLSALARVRIRTFQDIYDALPCLHWLGLTGGVELPAFKSRRDLVAGHSIISALQFGQASVEQLHFSGYSVDNFFVYDDLSATSYQQLGMHVNNMLVSGSTEFEYHTRLLCNEKLLEEDRLNIVFIDQPVQQRGEYSQEYLAACQSTLQALSNETAISIKIKSHPRGSAFDGMPPMGISLVEDWTDCLSRTHIVIGFFSNLCDLALHSGRITFYIGSSAILGRDKCNWITNQGGFVVDDAECVKQALSRFKSLRVEIADQIVSSATSTANLPSEIIYKRMVVCSESQTVT